MKQKRGISRYLLAMLLLLTIAITAGCGGGGGGGDGGGPSAVGNCTWDSSNWDSGCTWAP
ncbi:MAG: hypothetical protein WA240_03760 [Nitrospirota bacterium]